MKYYYDDDDDDDDIIIYWDTYQHTHMKSGYDWSVM